MPCNDIQNMRQIFFGAICALIIGIFALSAEPGFFELASPPAQDAYYNLLVQGFQSGQLNVKREAPPALAKVVNPYDPSVNTPYVWDSRYLSYEMSYYKGKLYLYFGVTPAIVLFWPYATLTGHYMSQRAAVVIFFALGFVISACVLRGIWRRYFPETNIWLLAAGVLALGLASGILQILSSCDVYEVAKSCAFAFTMFALGALWLALCEPKQQVKWLLLASLAYGLAIGSRPTLLFGAIILLAPVAKEWFSAKPPPRGQIISLFIAAVLPITLIGLGLMLYNELRFDSPFEFGLRYQLTRHQNYGARQFSLHYLWFDFRFYFLQPIQWTLHFPFLNTLPPPTVPSGYYGLGELYGGILINNPIAWLALAAPLAWRNRPAEEAVSLRCFIIAVFLCFFTTALTLCLFFGAGSGHESDFLPTLMLLAAIGILGVEHVTMGKGKWSLMARGGWLVLLAYSVLFNVFASLESRAVTKSFNGNFFLNQGRVDEATVQYDQSLTLWPGYSAANCGLGSVYLQQGRLDQAIDQYEKAVQTDPHFMEARNNLAYCFLKTGKMSEAIVQYQKVLELQPDFPEARNNLAYCLLAVGRVDDAITQYQKAVDLQPGSATYHFGLANALLPKGEFNQAMVEYQKALAINPDFLQAHTYLADCYLLNSQFDDAIVQFQKVIQLQPDSAEAYDNLGDAYRAKKMAAKAIVNYEKAIALQPQLMSAQTHLAWILATWPGASIRNGGKAVVLAEQANQLSGGNDPQVLRTLAAAYAETGRFPEAISTAGKALALAESQSDAALTNQLETEIGLYRKGSPCHTTGD
jgi:tetratricopeptide (TPR) repeat protein